MESTVLFISGIWFAMIYGDCREFKAVTWAVFLLVVWFGVGPLTNLDVA